MRFTRATVLTAAILATLGVTGAVAEPVKIAGTYDVHGTNADGSPYEGIAKITVTSKNTCRIVWDVGSESSGICMRNGVALAASYVLGKVVGLVIYEIKDDGTLAGRWTVADSDGVGKEVLTPRR